ncbi:MAG TPA: PAS domain S-box protein [Syntrophales bacterium]|nr:PAS domain S-box protein [Syntrophales bacterium]
MGNPLSVLIVEDSENDALLVFRMLEKSGYDLTYERVDRPEAMRSALQNKEWDIVLADYLMPGFSGIAALKLLKDAGLDIPFIIVSGRIGEETAVEVMKAGARDCIMKDKLERLIPAINRELQEASVRKGRRQAEEELKQARDNLERLVEERTAELSEKNQQLLEEIEERKLTEVALRESEERFRTLHEASFGGIGIHDGGAVLEANQGLASMTGYELSELVGLDGLKLIDTKSRDLVMKNILSGFEKPYEVMGLRKDGSTYPLEIQGKVIPYRGRKVRVTEFRDITERRLAEKTLRESEEKYRSLASTEDSMYLVDRDCRYLFMNDGHLSRFGIPLEKIIGRTYSEFHSEKYTEEFIEKVEHVFKTGTSIQHEYKSERDVRYFLRTFSPVKDKDGRATIAITVVSKDITDRKEAEEQLQQSKTMLQTVFDGISDPLIMMDGDYFVKMLNRAAKDYFKLNNYGDAIGKTCFNAFFGKSGPCEGCERPLSVMKGYAGTFERKGRIDPDRLEQVIVYPVKDEAGRQDAAIVRISDITEARLMQRQIMQSEKLASLGLLVSGIAHEINNPNSFIVFNIPILREYTEKLLPIVDDYVKNYPDFELFGMSYQEFRKDIFKLLDNIEHGSRRITNTVSGLKGFARRRDKQGRYRVDLRQVIEQGVAICRSEIKKTVRSFEVDIPENLPLIFTDPEAVEQILINLLINAAQASDKEDSWIRLRVATGDKYPNRHVIEVSDNGYGMDEKIKEKIFDPFFTTKASVGTGMGLYVCNTMVTGLGGHIEVESKPGRGSTFRVVLHNVE